MSGTRTFSWKTILVSVLLAWHFGLSGLLLLGGAENPKLPVLAKMLWGLNLLWIVGFGLISRVLRQRVAENGRKLSASRGPLIFTLCATILALIEEAITTTMTNCAPLFGAQLGEVYITASANYFDVVLCHSVVVFIPQFVLVGFLLSRFKISPWSAFICYGFTGFINEALFSGPNPLLLPQWIFIYGLMIYLPAHLFQQDESRREIKWWFYPILVFVPIIAAIPVVLLLVFVIIPGHPSIHFPPM